jgi:hypothetical protein
MSEILVEDSSAYPASVTVPEDGDARNAASVVVGFQALANRLAYIMLKMGAWILGGTITPLDDVTVHLANGHLNFTGIDDYNVIIGAGTKLSPSGRIANHCFTGTGGLGRANKRLRIENLAADGTFDPTMHDRTLFTPTGAARSITISTSTTPVVGDHCVVQNNSGTYQLTVKNQLGNTMIILAPHTTAAWVEVIWDGTFWVVGPSFPGV